MSSLPDGVTVAQLKTISLRSLRANENTVSEAEADKLFAACREHGCFYLNFRDSDGDLSSTLSELYELLKEVHELPINEKLRFDVDKLQLSKTKSNGYVKYTTDYTVTQIYTCPLIDC
jgi:isopenicillin N synthase-like dioxygenase